MHNHLSLRLKMKKLSFLNPKMQDQISKKTAILTDINELNLYNIKARMIKNVGYSNGLSLNI